MNMNTRISNRQLENIGRQISERDKAILEGIRKFRYLTSNQIWSLYFSESISPTAAHRAANRALIKLRELGLITTLKRRIGGVRAGSGSYIWNLATAGARLLGQNNEVANIPKRKRHFEPSRMFLEHTLAVAETYVQLALIQNKHENMDLLSVDVEPNCWRSYVGENGSITYLKPDLYIENVIGDYEDHWFFEIDLITESPSRILLKCQQYYRYYLRGAEQKKTGVFPLVVWITLSTKRAESLRKHIDEEFKTKQADIFRVIMPEELERLVVENTV